MHHIGKTERPGVDYLSGVVATTARNDAALLLRDGPLNPDDTDSARLLTALADTWPHDQFDELNICIRAPRDPKMLRALTFIEPRVGHDRSGRRLSRRNERDILRWILAVAGREIGGLRLSRNRIGWATVEIVGVPQ